MAGKAGRALGAGLLGVGVVAALLGVFEGAIGPGVAVQRGAVEAVRAAAAGADAWLADKPIHGSAAVSDGDTLRVGAVKIRLFGIDAPERDQRCGGWACGAAAAERLAELAGAGPVTCTPRDTDRYGRIVASCTVAGVDLGARLVAEGLARAYVRYGDEYAAVEAGAKAERVGVWRGEAEAPWEYRADRALERVAVRRGTGASAEGGEEGACRIKGNVSAGGRRIYHLPGTRGYAQTRIDPERGERWFCDEAAAQAAGFRPPRG